jgi:hypothetical protein
MSKKRQAEIRGPTTSSELLLTVFGLKPEDIGKKARKLAELQPPQSQGKTAVDLANHIINKGNDTNNKWFNEASIFFKEYNSKTCYICGGPISDAPNVEELEHLLPIAEALAFEIIIQKPRKVIEKNYDEIYNTDEGLGYLLEYARSHRCCNQIKGATSMFTFTGTPPYDNPYKINENAISMLLKKIWDNVRGQGTLYQDVTGCKEPFLVDYMSKIPKDIFIKGRKEILINNYFGKLLDFVKDRINHYGQGNFPFAQLVMISNQAMTIDQNIWSHMGVSWGGEIIDRNIVLTRLLEFSKNIKYDSSRGKAIEELTKIGELNLEILDYYNYKKMDRTSRTINSSNFSRFINLDYLNIVDIIRNFLEKGYQINENMNEGFLGFLYMKLFIESQAKDFVFYESMIPKLEEMMTNINIYSILIIYIYIIRFIPFKNDKTTKFPLPIELQTQMTDFIIINEKLTSYFQIHENYTNNIFKDNFYISTIRNDPPVAVNIKDLNNYSDFLLNGIIQNDTANTMLLLRDYPEQLNAASQLIDNNNYYNEEIRPTQALNKVKKRKLGGKKTYKKTYKKRKTAKKIKK